MLLRRPTSDQHGARSQTGGEGACLPGDAAYLSSVIKVREGVLWRDEEEEVEGRRREVRKRGEEGAEAGKS